ncbi:hypothetical protein MLD38_030480 [Melastoma candidum]|uniref:Uncharacterized protein n=1 Tax=Melastoma candidum TaxID=119954 RepID=A0ACB9MNB8_9MYRT|nr:hypothetical protein MLD38_030480 [Melastoma candidum]
MEARVEPPAHHFYKVGPVAGKRSLDWDLNDWKWDGDLFVARPLNQVVATDYRGHELFPVDNGVSVLGISSNCSSSCSDERNPVAENRGRENRMVVMVDGEGTDGKVNGLSLKLGGQGLPIARGDAGDCQRNHGKKAKVAGGSSSRALCQVENCGADLSSEKDYHRRHKVCEIHSKASKALVGGILQRFCQQCSRFHALPEFDEGKRSCRRRLAGHNKRRRKTILESTPSANTQNDGQTSSYLLISLLKILSSMHTNQSQVAPDQDLLTHILRSLANNHSGPSKKNISGPLPESQGILNGGQTAPEKSEVISTVLSKGHEGPSRANQPPKPSSPVIANASDAVPGQSKLNNFDLNDVYIDSDDGTDELDRSLVPGAMVDGSLVCPQWMLQDSHQSSPPQTSGTSDSVSAQSPSSSSGETQGRMDRIVFKLFGKEPNDFPLLLRSQILDWLSHSPTDIESHIRPGCIVLTIYLRQEEDAWEELLYDLSSSLRRLLDFSEDIFWKSGWMYIQVQHQMALIYEGKVVIETSLPLMSMRCSSIASIRPIAVSVSERAEFSVKGFNLCQPATRLLCVLEGKYLIQQAVEELIDGNADEDAREEMQSVKFCCSIPALTGRGFIEIEDSGFPGSFFPFIVSSEDVCSEIRTLEVALDFTGSDDDAHGTDKLTAKNQALDFLNEMGWILHRNGVRARLGELDPNTELFSFSRFEWLVHFSMDHNWCAVLKKLLDILFDGTVSTGDQPSIHAAVLELGLVHRAVRRNSRPLVDLLLRYVPPSVSERVGVEMQSFNDGSVGKFLFRPDAAGPAGLTPLHIAASKDGSEAMLDALTDDPGLVGVEAWRTAHDSTGSTPEDYARLRGHYSYIHFVQKKINKRNRPLHVVVDIPRVAPEESVDKRQSKGPSASLEIGNLRHGSSQQSCRQCTQKLTYGLRGRSLLYRPTMLSMVAIAAVCVCVALLFKSCPEVLYIFRPFRWEMLEYGSS